MMKSIFLILVSALLLVPSSSKSSCRVWNADGDEVTKDFVVDNVADCQGDNACNNLTISDCDKVYCRGRETCYYAKIYNVKSLVSCEEEHSCHRTTVVARLKDKAKVECIGDGACDVATLEGLDDVQCLGFKACRKAHIKANQVKCTGGERKFTACDLTYVHAHCMYCGVHGCGHNNCHSRIVGKKEPIVDPNEEFDAMLYQQCELESIMGNCPADWAEQLKYEKEVEYGTEENEDGTRRRHLR